MSDLNEIIRTEISLTGAISFARFMELALYHPTLGYYRRGRDPFGVRGDFYTAEQLPVFGQILAIYVEQFRNSFEPDARFEVLELGAGRGELAEALHPWNYQALKWGKTLKDNLSGLVIANEFFDALPVHLLRRCTEGWRELLVACNCDRFVFRGGRDLTTDLAQYAERYGAEIPEGGLLEVNLNTRAWLKRAGRALLRGRLLIIDYGYSMRELMRFPSGTLMGFQEHRARSDVLASPGMQDVTAHVNFSQLIKEAMDSGFEIVNDCSLKAWALQVFESAEWMRLWDSADAKWRLQWKELVFGMGETFRVLELDKEAPNKNAPERLGGDVEGSVS